jgi:glycosyltransferase involved in cell wall biosynthesis
MEPLLSICIPTYNRADWLRSSLWNWLPQVKQFGEQVELIVSDNTSTDHTQKIIDEAAEWGNFVYYRRPENLGPLKNIYYMLKDLAHGKFVWVVGDDDLPKSNAVEKVLIALKESPAVNFVYVNHSLGIKWNGKEIVKSEDLNFSEEPCSPNFEAKLVPRLADLVADDKGFFTSLLSSVWLRDDATLAFELGIHSPLYSSMKSMIPHAVYIAKNLLQTPGRYIGTPLIKLGLDCTWSKHRTFYTLEVVPSFFDLLETQGVDEQILKKQKREFLRKPSYWSLIELIHDKNHPMRKTFSLFEFIRRNYLFAEFWIIPGKIALYELNMLKRAILQRTLKRPYLLKQQ